MGNNDEIDTSDESTRNFVHQHSPSKYYCYIKPNFSNCFLYDNYFCTNDKKDVEKYRSGSQEPTMQYNG